MKTFTLAAFLTLWLTQFAYSQEQYYGGGSGGSQGQFNGAGSVGSNEQMYPFDDVQPWKHGYRQIMPYYGGWHSFRPYNYHHVFGQSQTAAGWGMSANMPYSQQFWHKYEVSASLGAPTYSANEQLRSDQWAGSNNVEQWTGTSRMPAAVISRSQLPMSQPQFAAPQYLQGGSQQPQLPTVLPSYDRDPQMDNIVPTGQVQGISYNPNRFRQYLQGNAPPQGVAPMQR